MGNLFGRIWGPQAHPEISQSIFHHGWLNVTTKDVFTSEVDQTAERTRPEESAMDNTKMTYRKEVFRSSQIYIAILGDKMRFFKSEESFRQGVLPY